MYIQLMGLPPHTNYTQLLLTSPQTSYTQLCFQADQLHSAEGLEC